MLDDGEYENVIDLTSLASAFKQALDIINGIKGLTPQPGRDKSVDAGITAFEKLVPGFWNDFFRIQSGINSVLREKDELVKKLECLENWSAEAERYILKEVGPGVFVYGLKDSVDNRGEPPHHICPNCFQDKKKSIFQVRSVSDYGTRMECLSCKSVIFTNPKV